METFYKVQGKVADARYIRCVAYSLFVFAIFSVTFSASGQTQVPFQSNWNYAPESNIPPTSGWNTSAGYNDASWNNKAAPFGFGGYKFKTELVRRPTPTSSNYPVYYFRRTFTIADIDTYSRFRLKTYFDDGLVLYVNGQEVKRH